MLVSAIGVYLRTQNNRRRLRVPYLNGVWSDLKRLSAGGFFIRNPRIGVQLLHSSEENTTQHNHQQLEVFQEAGLEDDLNFLYLKKLFGTVYLVAFLHRCR